MSSIEVRDESSAALARVSPERNTAESTRSTVLAASVKTADGTIEDDASAPELSELIAVEAETVTMRAVAGMVTSSAPG